MLWGGGGVIEVLHVIKKIEEIDFPKEGLAIGVYAFGCTFHSCDTQMIHIVCINAVKLSCLPYIPFHLYELKFFFWLHRTIIIPFWGASDQNEGLVMYNKLRNAHFRYGTFIVWSDGCLCVSVIPIVKWLIKRYN